MIALPYGLPGDFMSKLPSTLQDNPHKRIKVLIAESESVLTAGLRCLLMARDDLEVRGVSCKRMDEFIQAVRTFCPHVIIAEQNFVTNNLSILMDISLHYPRLRLVCLSLTSNHLQVYEKRLVYVEENADFFAVVS